MPLLQDLHAIAEGSVDAWERLIDACAPRMRAVAWRVLHDSHAVDDALQDAAVTLQRISPRCPATDDAGVLAWACGVALRVARNHARSRRRSLRRVQLGLPSASTMPAPEPEAEGVDDALLAQARRCLAELPARHREVIELHLATADSGPHLAVALGVSPGTARMRLHRALRQLQQAVRAQGTSVPALLAAWQAQPVPAPPPGWLATLHRPLAARPLVAASGMTLITASAIAAAACCGAALLAHGFQASGAGAAPLAVATPAPRSAPVHAARTAPQLDLEWCIRSPAAHELATAPVDAGDALILAGDQQVICVEKASGGIRWQHDRPGMGHSPPVRCGDAVLLWTPTGVGAFSLADGHEQWTASWHEPQGRGHTFTESLRVEGETVLVGWSTFLLTLSLNVHEQGRILRTQDLAPMSVLSVTPVAGHQLLLADPWMGLTARAVGGAQRWRTNLPGLFSEAPLVEGDLCYVTTAPDDGPGQLVAVRLGDGTIAWQTAVPQDPLPEQALRLYPEEQQAPKLTFLRVFDGTTGGRVLKPVDHLPPPAHVGVLAGPVLVDDRLVVASHTAILGYDRRGTLRWRTPYHSFTYEGFAVDGQGRVWIGNDEGELWALDPATGATLLDRRLDQDHEILVHPVTLQRAGTTFTSVGGLSAPLIVNGHLYCSTNGGLTMAWRMNTF